VAPEPITKAVASDRAGEGHYEHRKKLKPARPHQIASHRPHGFLRDWQSDIPEDDHE